MKKRSRERNYNSLSCSVLDMLRNSEEMRVVGKECARESVVRKSFEKFVCVCVCVCTHALT